MRLEIDNEGEFCGHQKLSESLKLECFFSKPYHLWKRGLNEYTNGLTRQFYPKPTNFKISILQNLIFQTLAITIIWSLNNGILPRFPNNLLASK